MTGNRVLTSRGIVDGAMSHIATRGVLCALRTLRKVRKVRQSAQL